GAGAGAGALVELDPAEVHHLKVRRVKDGAAVELRDGAGLVGTGVLRLSGRTARVAVLSSARAPRPVPLRLAVAAGDRERFAWLVEKATELGVSDIFPLETALTRGVASRLRGAQVERLRRRALEAVKQCGAAWAPVLHPPEPLERFLGRERDGTLWLADRAGEPPPTPPPSRPVTILVGPEGGLTEGERAAARDAGYRPVRLAEHVLRFETAALVAAASVSLARGAGGGRGGHG
ncbi:MAG TPA: RsmE family RNA methyltransferase, partial [Methylomirabilota bacterium]|nr:RsmE family RNA methyltransferase [Methylomirabilota bacterium]